MKRLLNWLLLFTLASCNPAFASQNATVLPTVSPYPGLTMLNNINSAFNTFQTNFSGASAPASPIASQLWVDTTNSLLKFYDGTNWLPIGKWSGSQWVAISNGVLSIAPTSTGSSNAYAVAYSPAVTALVVGQAYPFISNFQNSAAATLSINGLASHALTKQGAVPLAANDIPSGMAVLDFWDGTEFQFVGTLGNTAAGTVTSIATNNGVTGGTITSSGTIGLAPIGSGTFLANTGGSAAVPTATALTSVGVPTGTVIMWSTTTCPTGFAYENGQALSRTAQSTLFGVIGTTFGVGDGSTTYNVADLRGYFVRGYDDGAGIDPSRVFASTQLDAFQGHYHGTTLGLTGGAGGGASPTVGPTTGGGGATQFAGPAQSDGTDGTPRIAAETRPVNLALIYCIKL